MRVITFYSYKGGVGRTLTCANFGLYLAKTGQKVVLADMDFEAPGLDSKFSTVDVSQIRGGVLDLFCEFQNGNHCPEFNPVEIPLPDDVSRSGGRLQLIPAGNYLSPDYFKKLSSINWESFLGEELGMAFCLSLIRRIREELGADVFVIDSRTGLTEIGGLCTQVFPDTVLLFTCASPESLAGTKRIYNTIKNSPIIKKRHGGRDKVDLKIVVSRIPRPENLPAIDQSMKKRLGVDIDRLYYVFDQRDLSLEEYLALDRFADEHPAILDDYVQLFSGFNPEITMPYIEKRLENFRLEITRRSFEENERLIQELLTLFPQPEVLLEAARYYRLIKGSDSEIISNYIRYLDHCSSDFQVIKEFAQVCEKAAINELKPVEKVIKYLTLFGTTPMSANLLNKYFVLSKDENEWFQVVDAIEQDDSKFLSVDYRKTYFRVLKALKQWDKIILISSESEIREPFFGFIIAESQANLGNIDDTFNVLKCIEINSVNDIERLLAILYILFPEEDHFELLYNKIQKENLLQKKIFEDNRYMFRSITAKYNDPKHRQWLKKFFDVFVKDIQNPFEDEELPF